MCTSQHFVSGHPYQSQNVCGKICVLECCDNVYYPRTASRVYGEKFSQYIFPFVTDESGIRVEIKSRWSLGNACCHSVRNFMSSRYAPAHKLSANLYDIYHCCVYSEKLLKMDRGTVRNM